MVHFDDLDIAILSFVADHPHSTVTSCAKSIFDPKNIDDLQKKDAMLRHRFKILENQGLLSHTLESNHKHFTIITKKISFISGFNGISFGRQKLCLNDIKGDYCIVISTNDGMIVRSLDKLEKRWNK